MVSTVRCYRATKQKSVTLGLDGEICLATGGNFTLCAANQCAHIQVRLPDPILTQFPSLLTDTVTDTDTDKTLMIVVGAASSIAGVFLIVIAILIIFRWIIQLKHF